MTPSSDPHKVEKGELTRSGATPLERVVELDIGLYDAILKALKETLPEGCINFPMTGTVAHAATVATQRFQAERLLREMERSARIEAIAKRASDASSYTGAEETAQADVQFLLGLLYDA